MKTKYSTNSVLRAHRRVLRLVRGYLSKMTNDELAVLRTDGRGLMTFDELLTHVDSAVRLQVKR